ncbi:MAG TPA: hypothetical protein VGB67_10075 [Fibrella sp.]
MILEHASVICGVQKHVADGLSVIFTGLDAVVVPEQLTFARYHVLAVTIGEYVAEVAPAILVKVPASKEACCH